MANLVARLRGANVPVHVPTLRAEAADEIEYLRAALRDVLSVMPTFPPAASQIVGMETRYNAAISEARRMVAYPR